MDDSLTTILGYVLAPITGAVGWLAASRKRRNDFLNDLQSSINLLAAENKRLITEVVELRRENVQLRVEVEELNRKLENVRTITKKA